MEYTREQLEAMTRKELYGLAKSENVLVYGNYTKSRLIACILAKQSRPLMPVSMSARSKQRG